MIVVWMMIQMKHRSQKQKREDQDNREENFLMMIKKEFNHQLIQKDKPNQLNHHLKV
jgi:hypothetical protein